jgi:hypothetical protein
MAKIMTLGILLLSLKLIASPLDSSIVCHKGSRTCISYWGFNDPKASAFWKEKQWHSMKVSEVTLKKADYDSEIGLISELAKKPKSGSKCDHDLVISSSLQKPIEACSSTLSSSEQKVLKKIFN